eukprot:scaffold3701_cov149-Amphora_coffeaeformis.AAC.3
MMVDGGWWRDSLIEALSGAAAGATTRTVMAPLDRLKLVVQLQGSISQKAKDKGGNKHTHYSRAMGPWKALRTMLQQEGSIWALWRGNVPTLWIQGGTSALNFAFMDGYKKMARHVVVVERLDNPQPQQQERYRRLGQSLLSGGLAGATAMTVLYPLGVMRTQLALDMGRTDDRQYPRGMRDVFWQSIRSGGILRGLYPGYGVALASVSLYRMSELLVQRGLPSDSPASCLPFAERFVMAQIVSILASTAHYPLDSIRRRLMMQSDKTAAEKIYRSAWHCMQTIYRNEGIRGFYLGLGTNYIRSVGGALLLVSYDFFRGILVRE